MPLALNSGTSVRRFARSTKVQTFSACRLLAKPPWLHATGVKKVAVELPQRGARARGSRGRYAKRVSGEQPRLGQARDPLVNDPYGGGQRDERLHDAA